MAKHRVKRYDDGGDVDLNAEMGAKYSSQAQDSEPTESTEMPTPKATSTPVKAKVVTKEQLAASGYDNLRDYMNAQQKLKRRDGSAPAKATPEPAPTTVTKEKTIVTTPKSTAKYETPADRLGRENHEKGIDFDSVIKRVGSKIKDAVASSSRVKPSGSGKIDTANIDRKTLLPSKMAKGGMATASKRADGKITKGHTNCKVC